MEYCNLCQNFIPEEKYNYEVDLCKDCIRKLRRRFKSKKSKTNKPSESLLSIIK